MTDRPRTAPGLYDTGKGASRGTRPDRRQVRRRVPPASRLQICSANAPSVGAVKQRHAAAGRSRTPGRMRETNWHRQQRVSPQVEEIVVRADPLDIQHFRPDGRQLLLGGRARGDEIALPRRPVAAPIRVGQRAAVHLAAGGHGQRVQGDKRGGDHELGKPFAEELPQLGGRRARLAPSSRRVGRQLQIAGGPLAGRPRPRRPAAGCSRRTCSTSPGSMRKPRIFTW